VVHGRRHLLAVLAAVVLLGAAASFVTQVGDRPAPGSDQAATGRISVAETTPAALLARTTGAGDRLVDGKLRPPRLTGLNIVALLVAVAASALAGRGRAASGNASVGLAACFARTTPSRAPPLLHLVAS
jgi:hypothetical protein